jgi:hypothetical protein
MNERSEGDRMFWDNVAGADFKRQFTAGSYRQFFLDAGYSDVCDPPGGIRTGGLYLYTVLMEDSL